MIKIKLEIHRDSYFKFLRVNVIKGGLHGWIFIDIPLGIKIIKH